MLTEPCPYYEVGGREVDREEFEELLKKPVTDQRLASADWMALLFFSPLTLNHTLGLYYTRKALYRVTDNVFEDWKEVAA